MESYLKLMSQRKREDIEFDNEKSSLTKLYAIQDMDMDMVVDRYGYPNGMISKICYHFLKEMMEVPSKESI